MKLHLVLPGLVWPDAHATGTTARLSLPALERLLGQAQVKTLPGRAFEPWLARAFSLPIAQPPYGTLRRMGESGTPVSDGDWLCADPVHLRFVSDQLLLSDVDDLDVTRAEATALLEGLNQLLAAQEDDFVRFEAKSPRRWYLRVKTPPNASFTPINDVIGRPVSAALPSGPDGARWQRIGNDIQVFLHNHPINQAREAAGKGMINGVWFWGEGPLTPKPVAPAPLVLTRNRLARGLAIASGIRPDAPRRLPTLDAMVVLDALLRPSLYLDTDAWRTQLLKLELEWFAPALAALKSRRLNELRISAPGDRMTLEVHVGTLDLLKIWRRPLALDAVC